MALSDSQQSHHTATAEPSVHEIQFTEPPTTAEPKSDPGTILAWLKTCLATIYLKDIQKPFQQRDAPKLTRKAYLDLYSAVHQYCLATKLARRGLTGEDLYRCLEHEIRGFCTDAASQICSQQFDADFQHARGVLTEYDAQWQRLQGLAGLIANLFRSLERGWIRSAIWEKRANVHHIKEQHTVIWKEVVLQVGIDSSIAEAGSEIAKAVATLRGQVGEERWASSGFGSVEGFEEHLRNIGIRLGEGT